MKDKMQQQLIEQCIKLLKPFIQWIDLTKWETTLFEDDETEQPIDITFTNRNGKTIRISNIYYNVITGKIIQYGNNYGELVL